VLWRLKSDNKDAMALVKLKTMDLTMEELLEYKLNDVFQTVTDM